MAANKKEKPGEDMSLPPSFPQTFYAALNKAAQKAGMPRSAFAIKAIRFYSAALAKRNSPATKALGSSDAERYSEMSRKVSQTWWSKLTPEEKTARAKKAIGARWAKKNKTARKKDEG